MARIAEQARAVIVLRALFAVILLLNGLAMPPAHAMHATGGMASHAGHHSPMPAPESMPGHQGHGAPAGDCCNGMGCSCGCAVPHALILPVMSPLPVLLPAFPEFTFVVKSFDSDPLTAPFRPPA